VYENLFIVGGKAHHRTRGPPQTLLNKLCFSNLFGISGRGSTDRVRHR